MQVELWSHTETVHGDLSLTQAGQQRPQFRRFDEIGGTHPIANIRDVGRSIRRSGLQRGFKNRPQVRRAERHPCLECLQSRFHFTAAWSMEAVVESLSLDIDREQADAIRFRQRLKQGVQHRKTVLAVGTHLAGRGVDQDHVVASDHTLRQLTDLQYDRRKGLAAGRGVLQHARRCRDLRPHQREVRKPCGPPTNGDQGRHHNTTL